MAPGCVEPQNNDTDTCGMGIAFVVQGMSSSKRGAHGDDLGYGNSLKQLAFTAIAPSVAVEFDFKHSAAMSDANGKQFITT